MLLSEVLHDAGRTDEAVEHYGQALVLAEANDLRMQIGELLASVVLHPTVRDGWSTSTAALTVFRERCQEQNA